MATATKTTLNSKLPGVSKIAFCTGPGTGMSTSISTGESGAFTRKVGFKQASTSYPFQIQYRQRSRYTAANAKVKGATYTNWSNWKNAVAVSGIAKDATESQKPVNTWLKANKGVNTKGTYQTFMEFSSYLIPDTYDCRQFQFRIRTINKSKAKHGNWTSQTLTVYKKAWVRDERVITKADGGFKIKFNYLWDRKASIDVRSIKDSEGRELLRKEYTTSVGSCKLTASTIPAARSGYKAGQVLVPVAKLKRKVTTGESLTLDIRFVTADNAVTKLYSPRTVEEPHRDIGMTINHSWNESLGMLTVNVTNSDSIALEDVGCNVTYRYQGKSYSLAAFQETKNLAKSGTSVFRFFPPLNTELTLHVKEEDSQDFKDVEDNITLTCEGKGYRLNKVGSTSICGVAWGNPQWDLDSSPQYETALPYGRAKNIVFYGSGYTNQIAFTATILDREGMYGGTYARKQGWDNVRNNQGVYVFRSAKGDMFQVALTDVQIHHESKDLYEVDVSMVEVV